MALEPDTPQNQYAKMEYYIRLVGRIPRHLPGPDVEEAQEDQDDQDDQDDQEDQEMNQEEDQEMSQEEGKRKEKNGYRHLGFKLQGTTLCAIDVTMSHTAVMYAAGRLLDSIRQPFNASVIRAEMDALRSRDEAQVSPEDYEKWKEATCATKDVDPLVSESAHDAVEARKSIPRCAYLSQLLHKSFYVGGEPAFWAGARELDTRAPRSDGPRHIFGRAGHDSIKPRQTQAWYLYVDVSDPLRPRYVFLEEMDLVECTNADSYREVPKPLRLFNAREHAYRFMIPESEYYSESKKFGEQPWERHIAGARPTGRRHSIRLTEALNSNPEYMALLESRMQRAREHPAVVRMREFGWFRVEDAIKPDGSALLQEIWDYTLKWIDDEFHCWVVNKLVYRPEEITVIRSEALGEPDPPAPVEWEYSLVALGSHAFPHDESDASLKSASFHALTGPRKMNHETGGILTLLDQLDGMVEYNIMKTKLAHKLWLRSTRGGSGFHDAAYEWLHPDATLGPGEPRSICDTWLESDYDGFDHSTNPSDAVEWETWWILMYQGLCYRHAVAMERLQEGTIGDADSACSRQSPGALGVESQGFFDYGEYPGHALGDVAHPAFDVSHFSRIPEHTLLHALEIWSEQIWMPDLERDDWDFSRGTPVPLRTLNVSGCHFVTRNTIRRALQIAPSIRRIIMIGCVSFNDVDLMLLSLDGTLNNVDCILTSESVRAPFEDPSKKKALRDEAYAKARALLPQAPNESVQTELDSVPGVFFASTQGFKLAYATAVKDTYFYKNLYTRSLSHTFARPPALGFDPKTHQVICGPPRFSVILASHPVTGTPVTGATLPRVPIDTGIQGVGLNGSGLTSIWRGIVDLLEFLGEPRMRNKQRWNAINWSLVVKSCFSGPGKKWGQKSGLAGGGEFYGFPAYFKGGPGQANEEWIFAYQFKDTIRRIQTSWMNSTDAFVYPELTAQDSWAFIRYGRDANPLSHEVPTVVLYNVQEFRQAICPEIPILEDEARWIARVEDLLTNGTWKRDHPIINWEADNDWARHGNPTWEKLRTLADRLTKPKYLKEVPHELMLLIERMMTCQMNEGTDVF